MFLDPSSNMPFFYNVCTRESQWEQPAELEAKPLVPAEGPDAVGSADEAACETVALLLSWHTSTVNDCATILSAGQASTFVSLCRDHPRAARGALRTVQNMSRDPSLRERLCTAGVAEALIGRLFAVLCQLRYARRVVKERSAGAKTLANGAAQAREDASGSMALVAEKKKAARSGTKETKRALKEADAAAAESREVVAEAEKCQETAEQLVQRAAELTEAKAAVLCTVMETVAAVVDRHRPSQDLAVKFGACKVLVDILRQEDGHLAVAASDGIGACGHEHTVSQEEIERLGGLELMLARLKAAAAAPALSRALGSDRGDVEAEEMDARAEAEAELAVTRTAKSLAMCIRHNGRCSLRLCQLGALEVFVGIIGTHSGASRARRGGRRSPLPACAVRILGECAASNGSVRQHLSDAGLEQECGAAMLAMLGSGHIDEVSASTYALQHLVNGEDGLSRVVCEGGGVELMTQAFLQPMLSVESAWTQAVCSTARCLKIMVAQSDAMKISVRREGALEILVGALDSCGRPRKLMEETASVVGIRREITAVLACAATRCRDNQDELRELGVLPLCVGLVSAGSKLTQIEAANLLTQMCRDNTTNKELLRQVGGIKALATALRVGGDLAKQYVAETLCEAMDGEIETKFELLRWNGLAGLVEMIRESGLEHGRANAARALAVLCKNYSDPRDGIREADGIAPLVAVGLEGGEVDRHMSLHALEAIVQGNVRNMELVAELGGSRLLLHMVTSPQVKDHGRQFALVYLSRWASQPQHRRRLCDEGTIPHIIPLLRSNIPETRRLACRVLALAAWDEPSTQQTFKDHNGVVVLSALLQQQAVLLPSLEEKGTTDEELLWCCGIVSAVCWNCDESATLIEQLGGTAALRLMASSPPGGNEHVRRAAAQSLACCSRSDREFNGAPDLQQTLSIISATPGKWTCGLGGKRDAMARLLDVRADVSGGDFAQGGGYI